MNPEIIPFFLPGVTALYFNYKAARAREHGDEKASLIYLIGVAMMIVLIFLMLAYIVV